MCRYSRIYGKSARGVALHFHCYCGEARGTGHGKSGTFLATLLCDIMASINIKKADKSAFVCIYMAVVVVVVVKRSLAGSIFITLMGKVRFNDGCAKMCAVFQMYTYIVYLYIESSKPQQCLSRNYVWPLVT